MQHNLCFGSRHVGCADGLFTNSDTYTVGAHPFFWTRDNEQACNKYAVPPAYLASAAKEIQDNVKRMQPHPSIVLWAGNNEDEKDMKSAAGATPPNPESPAYITAYSLLTFETALGNVSALDDTRPLSGSSPSDGNETAAHPFSWDHQSEFYGDVHNYLYDVDNWDSTVFKSPRFMSEFGLQSWPSAITMSKVFPPTDWDFTSVRRRLCFWLGGLCACWFTSGWKQVTWCWCCLRLDDGVHRSHATEWCPLYLTIPRPPPPQHTRTRARARAGAVRKPEPSSRRTGRDGACLCMPVVAVQC